MSLELVKTYIESYQDVSQNPVQFSMKDLFDNSYEAFEFLQKEYGGVKNNIKVLLTCKRQHDLGYSDTINVNYVPYPKLTIYNHKKCNPSYLGKLYYLRGTIIGIGDPYMQKLFVYVCNKNICSMKNQEQFEPEFKVQCRYCNGKLPSPTVIRTCWIELVVMDEFNNQVTCRTRNMDNPDINLVKEVDNILGKKVELIVKPYEKPVGKKCIFEVDIVGYKQSDFSQLTPKRKERAVLIIKENKDNLMDMLIREIAPGHYEHNDIKKVILLTLVSPEPINICFYGDGGIGKSTLVLKFLDYIENSAFLTSQTTPSGAVVGIDTGGGENKLILGKLPRANNSVVLIDELNKQHMEIQDSLMHIMSEKKIVYSKIRSFTMDLKVSLIFCGNATSPEGRFDPEIPFYSQLNIGYPFMSRCHMVIKMDSAGTMDNLDEFGQYLLKRKKQTTKYNPQEIRDVLSLLRKQKKKYNRLAYDSLLKGWKNIVIQVNQTEQNNKMNILTETNRIAGNLKDLALAYSVFHEGDEVTKSDVEDVLRLFDKLHLESMTKTFGGIEKFRISTGVAEKYHRPKNDNERKYTILQLIKPKKEPIDIDLFVEECVGYLGVTNPKCKTLIGLLIQDNEIKEHHGKIIANLFPNEVQIEEIKDDSSDKLESWLFEQMGLNGGITELQQSVENKINEKQFETMMNNLEENHKIIIEKDTYRKL